MRPLSAELAEWAVNLKPAPQELQLARRSLLDTVAVTVAARDHPVARAAAELSDVGRWATLGHVLDYDDLHMPSTTHISAVCIPAVLGTGGDAHTYLAAAGAMARIGTALGWPHYSQGWHATCTAGAPAAAVGAALALGLGINGIARAIALAVPAAGGIQRAFGTMAKSLQVGFAAEAGVRAARLAAAGATADITALDDWLTLVGGKRERFSATGEAIPDGLAVKIFPCCYALQRPIAAVQQLRRLGPERAQQIERVVVRTPGGTLQPLIHSRPTSGLEGKFSLEYSIAAAILGDAMGSATFTDQAVQRPVAQELLQRVEVSAIPGGEWLLAGQVEIEVHHRDRSVEHTSLDFPPGSPQRAPTDSELQAKISDCTGDLAVSVSSLTWANAPQFLSGTLPLSTPAADLSMKANTRAGRAQ